MDVGNGQHFLKATRILLWFWHLQRIYVQTNNGNAGEKLASLKQSPYSFMVWVMAINSTLQGVLWYLLTLWNGKEEDLHRLEKSIVQFGWVGQKKSPYHRIDLDMLCRLKMEWGSI